ncbi:YbjQ family protein [Candidatus Bipolaricaulota bacterium]|nr:YbjQ family protein [Candidatus Bipolaricaulota bacterium]MBS3791884.1 YbjQ family protein [Candidatus Bipolaricaulota bacterium]
MKLYTTGEVVGQEIASNLGLVRGNTIRARGFGRDIMAGLRNIVGGEIKDYTEMLNDARDEAIERMVKEAEELEADGIVEIRFTTSQTMGNAAEILAYGTAVKFE